MPSNRGQTLMVPAQAMALRARGVFTAADGTALQTADTNWTRHANSGAGDVTIDNNRIHNTNDIAMHMYYHAWVPESADYAVSCDVVLRSDNDLSMAGPAARIDTAANTCYYVRYFTLGNIWQLLKVVAGSTTGLASTVGQTLTIDQPYRCTLWPRGSTLVVLVDGVPIITTTDTAITAAGRAGVRLQDAATSTVGVHLDNWEARQ